MSKEHCCCGSIHVKAGALIIGSLVLVFGIIGLLTSVTKGNGQGILGNVLSVIIGGCIIYADKSHKPVGYLPYLILSAIGIVIYTIFIVSFVIMAIAVPKTLSHYTKNYSYGNYGYGTQHEDREIDGLMTTMRGMFFFVAAVMAFVDCISIWLWMVIYRAYQHMKGAEEYDRGQTYKFKLNDV